MEEKKKKTSNKKNNPVKRSVRKMSLKEFALGKDLRRERIASIKIQVGENAYRTKKEWEQLFLEEKEKEGGNNGL